MKGEESLLLRGTCVATKLLGDCALHIGKKVLRDILHAPIEELRRKPISMEINPSKVPTGNINANRKNLLQFTENILNRVTSYKNWPRFVITFITICHHLIIAGSC